LGCESDHKKYLWNFYIEATAQELKRAYSLIRLADILILMDINREQLAGLLRQVYLFHNLDNEQIDRLLAEVELVLFQDGKMIYLENALSEAFYIVLEGKVEILKEKNHALVYKNIIKPFFGFGEDIFLDAQRITSARALDDVILIKINEHTLKSIAEENTAFHQAILQQYASYNYLINSRFKAIPEETLCFISQSHPIAVISKMAILLFGFIAAWLLIFLLRDQGLFTTRFFQWFLGACSLGAIIWLLYVYFEWSNDYFFFTDKRVSSTQRAYLFLEERRELPLSAVESIEIRKNFFGRALDFGNLEVNTLTGSTLIRQVPAVEKTQALLQYLVGKRRDLEKKEALKTFREDLQERIHPLAAYRNKKPNHDENEVETELEDDDLGTRTNQDKEEIILRKHFTVLVSKTFIPVFLLLSHFLFYLFVRINQYALASSTVFNGIMVIDTVIFIIWTLYRYLDWQNDRFIISDQMLIDIDRKPLGSEEKRSAPIERIQSIRYKKKGIFGLLFNFGTVYIRIGDEEFTFDDLYRPAEITQVIFDARERLLEAEKTSMHNEDHQRALDWIEAYHHLQNETKNKEQEDI